MQLPNRNSFLISEIVPNLNIIHKKHNCNCIIFFSESLFFCVCWLVSTGTQRSQTQCGALKMNVARLTVHVHPTITPTLLPKIDLRLLLYRLMTKFLNTNSMLTKGFSTPRGRTQMAAQSQRHSFFQTRASTGMIWCDSYTMMAMRLLAIVSIIRNPICGGKMLPKNNSKKR